MPDSLTHSQRLAAAGFKRRPSWRALPSDGEEDAPVPVEDQFPEAGKEVLWWHDGRWKRGSTFLRADGRSWSIEGHSWIEEAAPDRTAPTHWRLPPAPPAEGEAP